MTCKDPYTTQLEHLIRLASSDLRQWQLYAWGRAKELEADPSGLWPGITAALTVAINGPEKASASAPPNPAKPRSVTTR